MHEHAHYLYLRSILFCKFRSHNSVVIMLQYRHLFRLVNVRRILSIEEESKFLTDITREAQGALSAITSIK